MKCERCGAQNIEQAKFCILCGEAIEAAKKAKIAEQPSELIQETEPQLPEQGVTEPLHSEQELSQQQLQEQEAARQQQLKDQEATRQQQLRDQEAARQQQLREQEAARQLQEQEAARQQQLRDQEAARQQQLREQEAVRQLQEQEAARQRLQEQEAARQQQLREQEAARQLQEQEAARQQQLREQEEARQRLQEQEAARQRLQEQEAARQQQLQEQEEAELPFLETYDDEPQLQKQEETGLTLEMGEDEPLSSEQGTTQPLSQEPEEAELSGPGIYIQPETLATMVTSHSVQPAYPTVVSQKTAAPSVGVQTAIPPVMLCGRCGNPFGPNESFCAVCGTSVALAKTYDDAANKKKSKRAMVITLSVIGGIILLALALVLVNILSTANKYNKAIDYMNDGNYEEAYDLFSELGSYQDSESLKIICANNLLYEQAEEKFKNGDYRGAIEIYEMLNDFNDSKNKAAQCQQFINYDTAVYNFENEKFWDAYYMFDRLGDFKDSAERAQQCIQDLPDNGIVEKGSAYESGPCQVILINESSQYSMYIKFYTADYNFLCTVFVKPNSRTTIYVPVGAYRVNAAIGDKWFGQEDMFGDLGLYQPIVDKSSREPVFELKTGQGFYIQITDADLEGFKPYGSRILF